MRSVYVGLVLACAAITPGVAAELNGTLKRISESGRINLGYRVSTPPMSFQDPAGKPVGYSIELCEHIAAAVKKKLKRPDIASNYVPVTADTRFTAIEKGKIDILCGATTKTLSRSARVGFTQLTFITGGSLLSPKDAAISGIDDLKGKRIAVVTNTTTIDALKGALKERLIDAKVVPVSSATAGMTALKERQVDAFSADQVVLIGQMILRKSVSEYYLSQQLFSFEPFALAVKRGDADFQLVADTALSRLNRSGQIGSIYRRWFGRFALKPPIGLRALYKLNSTPE